MEIAIQIKDTNINAVLDRIAHKGGDVHGALAVIGERMLKQTEDHFSRERDADEKPWKRLSKATLKHRGDYKILSSAHNHLRDDQRYQVSSNTLRVGNHKVYGAIHQLGGMAGRGRKVRIPARPYLGIGEKESKEIIVILEDFIMEVK